MSSIERILSEYVVFLDYCSEETRAEIVRRLEEEIEVERALASDPL